MNVLVVGRIVVSILPIISVNIDCIDFESPLEDSPVYVSLLGDLIIDIRDRTLLMMLIDDFVDKGALDVQPVGLGIRDLGSDGWRVDLMN